MSKGQRGNKEAKKPKQKKAPAAPIPPAEVPRGGLGKAAAPAAEITRPGARWAIHKRPEAGRGRPSPAGIKPVAKPHLLAR
jgi:hypothetical protein